MHLSRNEGLFFKGLYSTSTLGVSRVTGGRSRATSGRSSSSRSSIQNNRSRGAKLQKAPAAASASAVSGAFARQQTKQQWDQPSGRQEVSAQAATQAQVWRDGTVIVAVAMYEWIRHADEEPIVHRWYH